VDVNNYDDDVDDSSVNQSIITLGTFSTVHFKVICEKGLLAINIEYFV